MIKNIKIGIPKLYDRNKGIVINIYKLDNYPLEDNVSFNFAVIKGRNAILDNDGLPAVFDSDEV